MWQDQAMKWEDQQVADAFREAWFGEPRGGDNHPFVEEPMWDFQQNWMREHGGHDAAVEAMPAEDSPEFIDFEDEWLRQRSPVWWDLNRKWHARMRRQQQQLENTGPWIDR